MARDSEQREWYRSYAVQIRDTPERVMSIERMIIRAINEQGISRDDVIERIFFAGIDVLMADATYGDTVTTQSRAVMNKVLEVRAQIEEQRRLNFLYEQLGKDGFEQWCNENSVDPQPTIDAFSIAVNNETPELKSWSTRAISWLQRHFRDGEPRDAKQVIEDAIRDGVLDDPIIVGGDEYLKQEKNFRSIASRAGYCSFNRRGVWQMVNQG